MSNIKQGATKETVATLLVKKELLSEEQLEKAQNIQQQTLERLEDILIRLGLLSEKQILDVWSEFLGIDVVDLTNIKVDANILTLVPEYQAKQYKMIPYKKSGNKLTVVMADPFDIIAVDMIAFLTQCKLEVMIAPKNQIDLAIRQLYSWDEFSISGSEDKKKVKFLDKDEGIEIARKTSEQGAVVQFLNAVFKQAILKRASDIHVEPREDILLIRFRIDGMLHDAMTGPQSLILPLVSRIKILSHLDIAERRLPQDGRMKVRMQNQDVDFRVSTVPSLLGEKVVLRLLQREAKFDLDNIGFENNDLSKLKTVLDEPYGLILVTGPTGAGKTTTLFGMLRYFSSTEINIFTIENPVEYRINGITQVQINEKIGLDFATGLKAALRQDPDVILVGEVRDLDTAEIAFRAALTGHKVLSTLHTNNAPASIDRLVNMGVPPYLVTAAIRAVIAQKLLHRICPHCKSEYRPSQNTFQRLRMSPNKVIGSKFFKGSGCKECNQTGTFGRLAVYETMLITPTLKDVIIEGGTEMAIKRVARLEGMKTLREMALSKAFDGMTTLEEVMYVTPSDDVEKRMPLSGLFNQTGGMMMPVAMTPGQQPIADANNSGNNVGNTNQGLDLNDPVIKTILNNLQKDYLFFDDEQLAEKLHLPTIQIKELLEIKELERTREGFQAYYGYFPEELQIDDITDIVTDVRARQGVIPSFIFEHEESTEKWAGITIKLAINELKGRMSNASDLPKMFTKEFVQNAGLEQIYILKGENLFNLIELVMPGKFAPWQFGEAKSWLDAKDISACAREALEWLMSEKLGCSRGDLPSMLSRKVFKDAGLGLLLEQFDDSSYRLVDTVFPNIFKRWQFVEEEPLIWFHEDRFDTAKEATRWLIEDRLGIKSDEIPKKISIREFHRNGLSKLLDLFNQNLFQVIENAYEDKFKPWEFSEQSDLWKAAEALETAKEATNWLIKEKLDLDPSKVAAKLTRRHFLNNGLGFMLGSLFNHSHFMALENAFPELKSNEIFQKALFTYSQELRDVAVKWKAISEKIATNHFGKVRFKVTLPNLKVAPIVPENERIYINAANQIEYVPQIVIPRLNAYSDFSAFANWVPYCDRLSYWILGDDREVGYADPSHPKVKLVFAESLLSGLRAKGLLDMVEKVQSLISAHKRLLDHKAPAGIQ